jgi:hypothetical protein
MTDSSDDDVHPLRAHPECTHLSGRKMFATNFQTEVKYTVQVIISPKNGSVANLKAVINNKC